MQPKPDDIRKVRKEAGLTQKEAGALIGKTLRTWQNWETKEGNKNNRKMDGALWELFLIKLSQLR
jgi:DNA-binding transcriptional regulator YiaG